MNSFSNIASIAALLCASSLQAATIVYQDDYVDLGNSGEGTQAIWADSEGLGTWTLGFGDDIANTGPAGGSIATWNVGASRYGFSTRFFEDASAGQPYELRAGTSTASQSLHLVWTANQDVTFDGFVGLLENTLTHGGSERVTHRIGLYDASASSFNGIVTRTGASSNGSVNDVSITAATFLADTGSLTIEAGDSLIYIIDSNGFANKDVKVNQFDISVISTIPEPSEYAMMLGFGIVGLTFYVRKKSRK